MITKNTLFERHAATIKAMAIAVLVLLLLIPIARVESLIMEREARKEGVITEIAGKWGRDQVIAGPVIRIPYTEEVEDKRGRIAQVIKSAYLLPENLEITGDIRPEVRYRGIFEAVLYETDLTLKGKFSFGELQKLNIDQSKLDFSNATVLIGISDIKGIKEEINFRWGEQPLSFNPGTSGKVISSGVSAKLENFDPQQNRDFTAKISLRGSRGIAFAPVGMKTSAKLNSSWQSPSFSGSFLPVERSVSEQGFAAVWKVLHFNRNYPQAWLNEQYEISCSLFGVDLLVTADAYQQSIRTLKYAILFIGLTFAAFFFSEVVNKTRVHPSQYLLIGFALVIFYSMLTAISEHLTFGWAYLVSAISVTGLISFYARSVLASTSLCVMVGGILTTLYAYLYFLLQMEDYALLFGSTGLFAVLTLVMYFTRKFDWYDLTVRSVDNEQ